MTGNIRKKQQKSGTKLSPNFTKTMRLQLTGILLWDSWLILII